MEQVTKDALKFIGREAVEMSKLVLRRTISRIHQRILKIRRERGILELEQDLY